MIEVKINKRGQITIPKAIRKKLGLSPNISLTVTDEDRRIILEPAIYCHYCKKPLSDEFREERACPTCPPIKTIHVY